MSHSKRRFVRATEGTNRDPAESRPHLLVRLSQGKVAQTACMSACKHISTSLMQLLLNPEVRQISIGALHQLNVDLKECESFARASPVAGFQGDTLLLAFSDLRQERMKSECFQTFL
ncbi:Exocyst complex component 6B [Goodea atripinnis]|uniref:Exocyst complex component 6B n=1 Tax=Goodea atripinnis TaxID=208336 RepID=A0ABV0PV19_9TELE